MNPSGQKNQPNPNILRLGELRGNGNHHFSRSLPLMSCVRAAMVRIFRHHRARNDSRRRQGAMFSDRCGTDPFPFIATASFVVNLMRPFRRGLLAITNDRKGLELANRFYLNHLQLSEKRVLLRRGFLPGSFLSILQLAMCNCVSHVGWTA